MTVENTDIVAGPYTGTGSTDTYAYDWTILDKSEVLVYEISDTGASSLLTVDTDYTVGNVGVEGGGNITRTAGNLPSGYQWLITSNFAPTQETSFSSQGRFDPGVHEAAFDKLTRLIQQIEEVNNRTLQLSVTSQGVSAVLPDPIPGYTIVWNAGGTALESAAPDSTLVYVGASEPDETLYQLWYDTGVEALKYWNGSSFSTIPGDVQGPASAVADRIAVFDGITGKLLKDGGDTIAEIVSDYEAYADAVGAAAAAYTDAQIAGVSIRHTPVDGLASSQTSTVGVPVAITDYFDLDIPASGHLEILPLALAVNCNSSAASTPAFCLEVDGTPYDLIYSVLSTTRGAYRCTLPAYSSTTVVYFSSLISFAIIPRASIDDMVAVLGMPTGTQSCRLMIEHTTGAATGFNYRGDVLQGKFLVETINGD